MKLILCNLIVALLFTTIVAKSLNSFGLPEGRISGGKNAAIEDFPYQVQLLIDYEPQCGASILSEDVILTAAHCIIDIPTYRYQVHAGSIYPNKKGVVRNVTKIINHHLWNTMTIDYDFSLILLSEPLEFSKTIQQIALPEEHDYLEAMERVNITGWGLITETGPAATVLQKLENEPVIDQDECIKLIGSSITPRMLCTGDVEVGKSPCVGDSGGPVVSNGKVHGVVSWGIGCGQPGNPSVHARVTAVREWIRSKVNL